MPSIRITITTEDGEVLERLDVRDDKSTPIELAKGIENALSEVYEVKDPDEDWFE